MNYQNLIYKLSTLDADDGDIGRVIEGLPDTLEEIETLRIEHYAYNPRRRPIVQTAIALAFGLSDAQAEQLTGIRQCVKVAG